MSNPPIPIEILYPNGRVLGVQVFVVSTISGDPIEWDGSVTGGGGGGGGAVTIANGADVAEGSTGDVAWVSGNGTVISLLKKIASAGGSAVSIADGADVAEGSTGDAAWSGSGAGTVVALLKKIATGSSGTVFATITSGTITSIANPVTVTGTIALTTTSSVAINGGVLATISGSVLATVSGSVFATISNAVNATVSGNVTATINNTTFNVNGITNPIHAIIDNASIPVTGAINATISGTATVTNDGSFATPAGQNTANSTLAQILANQIIPLGGPQAIAQNAYWVTHRLDEQILIESYKQTVDSMISSESENSQRVGYELR